MTPASVVNTRPQGLAFAAAGGLSSLLFGLSVAASPMMGVALAAGAAVLCVALFAPAALLLAWIGASPMLSTWLDVNAGPLPTVTPARAILAVLLPVTAWRWLRRPHTVLPVGRLELLMAWFIVLAAASAVVSGGSRQTNMALVNVQGGLKLDLVFLFLSYGVPFLAFFLAKNLLEREHHIRWLLGTFIVVGVFVGMTGIVQYYFGITYFIPTRMDVIHEGRATGTMTSAPEFGVVVGTPLLTAIICFLRTRSGFERLLLAAAIPIMVVAVVASKTRVIWVGVAFGLVVAALYEPRLRKHVAAVAIASALALAAAWPFLANSEFIRLRVLDMEPIYFRIGTTATALNMIVHSPLVGHGFGRFTFDNKKWPYIAGGARGSYYAYTAGVPHNEYLHVLVLMGLLGFVPFVSILVLAWRTASHHYREGFRDVAGSQRDIALIFLSAFTLYLLAESTSDGIFFGFASGQIYALLGAIEGLRVRRARQVAAGGVT
jgi:O-antigen ligase